MSNVAELTVPGRRRFEQQSIAGLVAVRVVERLEVVDVEQRDGQRLTGSPRSRQLAGELLIPAAAVASPVSGSVREGGRIGALEKRTEPSELSRAVNRDARERGL